MGYRKFSAEQIFTGRELVTGRVLVTDAEGRVEALIDRQDAGDDVQHCEGILTPGFINAHCHLELSHMKGLLPPHTGMVDFLLGVMGQRAASEQLVLQAIDTAETAMWEKGIVAVGDICNTALSLPQKRAGRLYYHNFIEATGFVDATAGARFAAAEAVYDQLLPAGQAAESRWENNCSIVPHAPYSVSATLFGLITGKAPQGLLSMHNQESEAEEQFMQSGQGGFNRLYETLGLDISFYHPKGRSSLQTTLPRFRPGQSLILVHNVTTCEADLLFLQAGRQSGLLPEVHFCLCPNANLYIGNGLPDLALLQRHGVSLVVGTDSLASNETLDIAAELQTLQRHFPAVSMAALLQMATLNGALALGIGGRYGSFEAGKQPGIVLLDADLGNPRRVL